MGDNTLHRVIPGAGALTTDDLNQYHRATSGVWVPRRGGVPDTTRSVDVGLRHLTFRKAWASEAVDLDGFHARTNLYFFAYNGVLENPHFGDYTFTSWSLSANDTQTEVILNPRVLAAAGGKGWRVAQSTQCPRPVGTPTKYRTPTGLEFIGWYGNLWGYNPENFFHAAYYHLPHYLVTLDVSDGQPHIVGWSGVFIDASAFPTSDPEGVGLTTEGNRLYSLANNHIYKREGGQWVRTFEAFVGAVSYQEDGVIINNLFSCRSRQTLLLVSSLPVFTRLKYQKDTREGVRDIDLDTSDKLLPEDERHDDEEVRRNFAFFIPDGKSVRTAGGNGRLTTVLSYNSGGGTELDYATSRLTARFGASPILDVGVPDPPEYSAGLYLDPIRGYYGWVQTLRVLPDDPTEEDRTLPPHPYGQTARFPVAGMHPWRPARATMIFEVAHFGEGTDDDPVRRWGFSYSPHCYNAVCADFQSGAEVR